MSELDKGLTMARRARSGSYGRPEDLWRAGRSWNGETVCGATKKKKMWDAAGLGRHGGAVNYVESRRAATGEKAALGVRGGGCTCNAEATMGLGLRLGLGLRRAHDRDARTRIPLDEGRTLALALAAARIAKTLSAGRIASICVRKGSSERGGIRPPRASPSPKR